MSYLPPEWSNDDRMGVMMGEMPSSQKDSVAFKGRMNFWKANLVRWLEASGNLVFSVNDAQFAFLRGTQTPKCLPQVVQQLVKEGELLLIKNLVAPLNKQVSWFSWGKNVISTPVKWAYNYASGYNIQEEKLVHSQVLQKKANTLLDTFWALPHSELGEERVIPIDDLFQIVKQHMGLTLDDLYVLIHFLVGKNKAVLVEHRENWVVKFAKPGQEKVSEITQTDFAECDLLSTVKKLDKRIKIVETEKEEAKALVNKLVASNERSKALTSLRRKKKCEKSLENLISTRDNVTTCLDRLRDSQLNRDVLRSFQAGATALKSTLSEIGTAESVQDSMDALQDTLDECHEISEPLSTGVTLPDVLDPEDDELLEELNRLMIEPSLPKQSRDFGLPNVPAGDPIILPESVLGSLKESEMFHA